MQEIGSMGTDGCLEQDLQSFLIVLKFDTDSYAENF